MAYVPSWVLVLATGIFAVSGDKITDVEIAKQWLEEYETRAMEAYSSAIEAAWNFNTDITDENKKRKVSRAARKFTLSFREKVCLCLVENSN